MTSKSGITKLGVLNMSICFEHPSQPQKIKRDAEQKSVRVHPVPIFIPRCSPSRQTNNVFVQKREEQLSSYRRYHHSQKESIRYYRERYQSSRRESKIQALSPRSDKIIQFEFKDPFQRQQKLIITANPSNEGHLKLVFNKRHLRNTVDLTNKNKVESFGGYLSVNPEENLQNIFTARSIKTSVRDRIKSSSKKTSKFLFRAPKTKQEMRGKEQKLEESTLVEKKIRPWSPNRSYFNKELMFQSEILPPLEPQQPRLS